MAHVWIIEVRDRDTTRPGGWTAWKPSLLNARISSHLTRSDAEYSLHYWYRNHLDFQYRVRRYDRREP